MHLEYLRWQDWVNLRHFFLQWGVGTTNFIFTLLAIFFIDRLGRRLLMHIGSVGLIVDASSWLPFHFTSENEQMARVPINLFLYIGFFAFSQGAVIWVFIAEIFPNDPMTQGPNANWTIGREFYPLDYG